MAPPTIVQRYESLLYEALELQTQSEFERDDEEKKRLHERAVKVLVEALKIREKHPKIDPNRIDIRTRTQVFTREEGRAWINGRL